MADLPNLRDKENEESLDPKKTALFMALTFADTTWRIFVPSVGLLLLGVYIDRTLNTKPIWMIVGLIIGVVMAIWLVKIQLQRKV